MSHSEMWPKKKPLNHDSEKNRKEMATVERRLSNVELRLEVLSDRVNVLSREAEKK